MADFICPKTNEQFQHSVYRQVFKDGKKIFKDNAGNQLVNPNNGEPLVLIEKKWEGTMPSVGKFNGMSPAQRKKVLKKRSAEHNASPEQKDEYHHKNITGTQKAKGVG